MCRSRTPAAILQFVPMLSLQSPIRQPLQVLRKHRLPARVTMPAYCAQLVHRSNLLLRETYPHPQSPAKRAFCTPDALAECAVCIPDVSTGRGATPALPGAATLAPPMEPRKNRWVIPNRTRASTPARAVHAIAAPSTPRGPMSHHKLNKYAGSS